MFENLTGKCRLNISYSLFSEIRFFSNRICHHVNVRMIALIVKCSIPAQIGKRYLHILGNGFRLRAQEIPPRIGVVITKTRSVLATKGQDTSCSVSSV